MLPYDDDVKIESVPDTTYWLILVCTVVFLYQYYVCQSLGTSHQIAGALVPERLLHNPDAFQLCTLLTSVFMHGGFYHLISNMWCLYLFGRSVEDRMGRVSFLAFYLLCGLAANLCWVYLNQCSQNPALGASGAISGVMAAYVVFFPGAQVKVWMGWMIGKIKVPAILVMLIFYVLNAVPAWVVATTGSGGQVAYAAHVGGFLAGLVLCKVFETRHTAPEMLVSDGERWK